MISAIVNNPYRILGVFIDADIKSLYSKMSACGFNANALIPETDFNIEGLPAPVRNPFTIQDAFNKLLNEESVLKYKFFWFHSDENSEGLEFVKKGHLTQSHHAFFGDLSKPSEHNDIVAALMQNDFATAALHFIYLSESYQAFDVCYGLEHCNRDEIISQFRNALYDKTNANDSIQWKTQSTPSWQEFMNNAIFSHRWKEIQRCDMQPAKGAIQEGNLGSYLQAAEKLVKAKNGLRTIKLFLGDSDYRYRGVSDALTKLLITWNDFYFINANSPFKALDLYDTYSAFCDVSYSPVIESYLRLRSKEMRCVSTFRLSKKVEDYLFKLEQKFYTLYGTDDASIDMYVEALNDSQKEIKDLSDLIDRDSWFYRASISFIAQVGYTICLRNWKHPYNDDLHNKIQSVINLIETSFSNTVLLDSARKTLTNLNNSLNRDRTSNPTPTATPPIGKRIITNNASNNPNNPFTEADFFKKNCNSIEGCSLYLRKYPRGIYRREAYYLLLQLTANIDPSNNGKPT